MIFTAVEELGEKEICTNGGLPLSKKRGEGLEQ